MDLFTPVPGEVPVVAAALVRELRRLGYDAHGIRSSDTFARVEVRDDQQRGVLVELGQDSRMRAPVTLAFGPVLHPDEVAASKTLALFSRALARDLVDIDVLLQRYGRDELLALATEKDPGFVRDVFAAALGVAAARPGGDFAEVGVSRAGVDELRRRAIRWRDDLRAAADS